MAVHILREDELRRCARFAELELQAVEEAFVLASSGRAEIPPVMHIEVSEAPGDFDIKSAYLHGKPSIAVKIASGFFGNAHKGLPTGSALMVVLSAETGFCEAVLLDNGYLTDLRTGLAGAVAARHLAPAAVETAGVVGVGIQGRFQIRSLKLVRNFRRLLVYGRDPARVELYRREMQETVGSEIVAANSVEQVVRESQCVVTTTPARSSLVRAEWLHPGLHVTAMGSDLTGKQELDTDVLRRADLLACDLRSQARRIGELQHLSSGEGTRAVELGEIASGQRPGRIDEAQITVCDLSGIGAQDTAIALLALHRAKEQGLGTVS